MQRHGRQLVHGTADGCTQNILLDRERASRSHVIILSGDHIYKMDYSRMLDYHKETKASHAGHAAGFRRRGLPLRRWKWPGARGDGIPGEAGHDQFPVPFQPRTPWTPRWEFTSSTRKRC